jgi:hypothetical protein
MTINAFTVTTLNTFKQMFGQIQDHLLDSDPIVVGEWQSQKTEMPMRELLNLVFSMKLPETASELAISTGAHLPWAEDHFLERVGGVPLNPAPSEEWWPFAQKVNREHKSEEGGKFSHTYPERMWPKRANMEMTDLAEHDPMRDVELGYLEPPHYGIRFEYGDLRDVVNQLVKHPFTRQAYLPIWFPEDTGAVHGKRVPCTLGYHFTIRNGVLNITYFMRSTDLLRHFQDDVYLAGRLAQWMVECINQQMGTTGMYERLEVGDLIFHTANMHIFDGDVPMIEYRKTQGLVWNE